MRNPFLKFFLIGIFFYHSTLLYGATLSCRLSSKSRSSENKNFTYDLENEVGKNLSVFDHQFIFWKTKEFIIAKLVPNREGLPLSGKFPLKSLEIKHNFDSDFSLDCAVKKFEVPAKLDKKKGNKISNSDLFESLKERVKFVVNSKLVFMWDQPEESQNMRTLFFQNGSVFIKSSDMEQKMPWCSFRVQLKEQKNTEVYKDEVFIPESFQVHNNNTYFTTYIYSFSLDQKFEGKNYRPFLLSCNILRGMPFTVELFNKITETNFSLKPN